MKDLYKLADLIRERNTVAARISAITNRPATMGHVGEFIASRIFDVGLQGSASQRAIDGHFRSGPLAQRSVNIKWYAKQESLLSITPASLPDYYLVLTGPEGPAASSRGEIRPWLIHRVYLFEARALVSDLQQRGLKIGDATSVRRVLWEAAEVYPTQRNTVFVLSDKQKELLSLFGDT